MESTYTTSLATSDYYPYGLPHATATAPQLNRRKYGAKELTTDLGLNLYDFAARWHNPAFPRFTTPDPLTETYTPISPYTYCASDPINHTDPTGCKVVIHESSSREFISKYNEAKKYLSGTTAGRIISHVESTDKYTITLIDSSPWHRTCFDFENNRLYWDPNLGVYTTTLYFISPAENLGHEFDHVKEYNENPKETLKNKYTEVNGYVNKEEERVIKGAETKTAQELGKINGDQQTRYDHFGTTYQVPSVSSTEEDI